MDEPQTCGRGLAEHAAVPAKIAELISALVANLELHRHTLDLTDRNARLENNAYTLLATQFTSIANDLRETAQQMAGYGDLPAATHNPQKLAEPRILNHLATFVKIERELVSLLQRSIARDERMLS